MYKKVVLSYIDILGFRDLLNERSADEIDQILDQLEISLGEEDIRLGNPYSLNFFMFSDLIVRVWPIESEANIRMPIGLLYWELYSLMLAQCELILKGVLIRGGVTIGEVSYNSNRVFGPALVKAYEMESRYSIYPRVTIDPDALKGIENVPFLKSEGHSVEDEMKYLLDLLKQDQNGLWFIDYLTAFQDNVDDAADYPMFLKSHKELIMRFANKLSGFSSESIKLSWLAHYHNSVVGEPSQEWSDYYGLERPDVIVPIDKFPWEYNVFSKPNVKHDLRPG